MLILLYFIKRGTDLKFKFLQPMLAKIGLIYQQPVMSQWVGVQKQVPFSRDGERLSR